MLDYIIYFLIVLIYSFLIKKSDENVKSNIKSRLQKLQKKGAALSITRHKPPKPEQMQKLKYISDYFMNRLITLAG